MRRFMGVDCNKRALEGCIELWHSYTDWALQHVMKRFLIGLIALAVVASAACRKKEAFPPSRLFGKTYSGQSLQTVQRELKIGGGEWSVVEDQRSLSGGSEPPSRLYIVSKPSFAEYGATGDLVLSFFNDELVSAKYYISNVAEACSSIESQQGISLCSGGDAHIEPSTRVWIGKDTSGRSYIGWIDKQRQAALDNWNAAHAK